MRSVGRRSYSAFGVSKFGALRVAVRGSVVRTVFLDGSETDTGQELDPWTMVKGPVSPALRARSEHPTPGGTFRYAVDAPAGSGFAVFATLAPGYRRVPGLGVWHLAVGQEVLIEAGLMASSGTAEFSVAVPPSPALSGQDFFLQGVGFDPTTGRGLVLTDLLESRVK